MADASWTQSETGQWTRHDGSRVYVVDRRGAEWFLTVWHGERYFEEHPPRATAEEAMGDAW